MNIYSGKSVSGGIAIGKIAVLSERITKAVPQPITDTAEETQRFRKSLNIAKSQLEKLYNEAIDKVGVSSAEIFDIHKMMLEDEDYIESIESTINSEMVNAEYAVFKTGEEFAAMFSKMDNEYMRGRSADVIDVSQRIISSLCGSEHDGQKLSEPSIIVAEDLSPSETLQLDRKNILAIVTRGGSALSHTAILAGVMNIPAIVGADIPIDSTMNGQIAAVDSYSGKIYLNPDNALLMPLMERINEDKKRSARFDHLRGMETVTLDKKKIMLYANITSPNDAEYAIKNDAEGIGLFRSEFLYIGRPDPPGEEEQFEAYKEVAVKMKGKSVIIRTFDLGADKRADFIHFENEENPAMGMRGIRLNLLKENLLKTQLRAIYRASVYGNISVMYPMIISVNEIRRVKKISSEVRSELARENIPIGIVKEGIMVETPAAAVISDKLAQEADFFSIGTNDLTQYTLAADRQNSHLGDTYDAFHPAVFRLIEMVCKNAHAHGIWVGICGELGSNAEAAAQLLQFGVDEFSVSPTKILPMREIISNSKVFHTGQDG